MKKSATATARLLELDAIRGIAAMMVVLYHYTTWHEQSLGYSTTEPLFRFQDGKVGVYLFFIVSGFVIFMSLCSTRTIFNFVISRGARLYPAYWAGVLLTSAILILFPIPGREVTIEQAAVNLTMFQKWLRVPAIDGVYWTLAVELSFYFIFSLLFFFRQLRNIDLITSLWLGMIFLTAMAEELWGIFIPGAVKLTLLLEYGSLFLAGVMFYRIFTNHTIHAKVNLCVAFVISCLLFWEYFWWISLFHVVFLLIVLRRGGFLTVKPLVFLGNISYSLYLLHQNIGYVIINLLEKFGLANSYTILFIPMVSSILLAATVYSFIEISGRKFIRKLLQRPVACSSEEFKRSR